MLQINSRTKINKEPYTRKEILVNEFPELWNRANKAIEKLISLQNSLVEILPNSKAVVPNSFDSQGNDVAEKNLLTHIYLLSFYSFANKVAQMIEEQCKTLAENSNQSETEEDELKNTLDTFDAFPWEDLKQDHNTGLLRLNGLKEHFKQNMDWNVFRQWSFRDIFGSIETHGLKCGSMWKEANEFPIPAKSNIVPLLANDDDMIRIN